MNPSIKIGLAIFMQALCKCLQCTVYLNDIFVKNSAYLMLNRAAHLIVIMHLPIGTSLSHISLNYAANAKTNFNKLLFTR